MNRLIMIGFGFAGLSVVAMLPPLWKLWKKQVNLTSLLLLLLHRSPCFKIPQNLDLRCVLLSDPSTFGAGGPNQTTSQIQILRSRSLNHI